MSDVEAHMAPPRDPYDWEADDERRRSRATDHWYRGPDNSPLMSGQFWALWTAHQQEFRALQERVDQNEERLMEARAKQFVGDIVGTALGKGVIIVVAILTAFVLTNFIHVPGGWSPW